MRVLITGGAGFIGSHLAERLFNRGHFYINIIDNLETGRIENLEGLLRYSYHKIDVLDYELLSKLFEIFPPDIVVHCAASYKDPDNFIRDAKVNCVGTANICELSKRNKIKRIIYLQTSLCYGVNPQRGHSIFEADQPFQVPIYCPINPAPNSYAITKTAAEQLIAMSGVPFVSFRLANCYGPRNLSGPIPTFYKNLKGGVTSTVVDTRRDFVYIDDLVDLLERAVTDKVRRSYYHVSSGRDYMIKEIYYKVAKWLFRSVSFIPKPIEKKRSPEDAETILLDSSQTLEDFPGWAISTPLEVGIKKTVEWYQKNKITETYTHLRENF